MGEFSQPNNETEFERNFAQIKPLMNETQAYYESSRCLFCFDAPCINACPTAIDIPLFIRQINSGNTEGAAKTIYNANYLGNACGKVCPTEVLCEGACVYNNQEVKPIEIGRLQTYATTHVMENHKKIFQVNKSNGVKVAIIGAGPAGLSCACELSRMGYEVDIYEAKSYPSGLTIHGVAPYKITNADVIQEVNYLQQQFGFEIFYDHEIDSQKKLNELEHNYQAIFLGIGLGPTQGINLPGRSLTNCFGAVEFIERLKLTHEQVKIEKKVIVLGGGNTAMDAASEAARMGASTVMLAYRGSKEKMSAYKFEYDLAKGAGVKGIFNALPREIVGKNQVEGVKFIKTHYANGSIQELPDSEFTEYCDMVILATGQSKLVDFLGLIDGLNLDEKHRIVVNESYQTTNKKYFAAGDAFNGGMEVVNAVAEAKVAAKGIHEYLSSKI